VNDIIAIMKERTGEEVIVVGFRSIREGEVVFKNVQNINAGKAAFKKTDFRTFSLINSFLPINHITVISYSL
jgi:hypothetical protein